MKVAGCQPKAPAAFTPRIILVLIFRGWVRCHGKKNPATSRIDPVTFWLVAQCRSHYATPGLYLLYPYSYLLPRTDTFASTYFSRNYLRNSAALYVHTADHEMIYSVLGGRVWRCPGLLTVAEPDNSDWWQQQTVLLLPADWKRAAFRVACSERVNCANAFRSGSSN